MTNSTKCAGSISVSSTSKSGSSYPVLEKHCNSGPGQSSEMLLTSLSPRMLTSFEYGAADWDWTLANKPAVTSMEMVLMLFDSSFAGDRLQTKYMSVYTRYQ